MDNDNTNHLAHHFQNRGGVSNGTKGAWQPPGVQAQTHACYATARQGEVLKRFKLIFRDAKSISIPYALMPILKLESAADLRIFTPDLQVFIKGRGLHKLEEYLAMDLVKWIKESPGGKDDGGADIFISEITLECDYVF